MSDFMDNGSRINEMQENKDKLLSDFGATRRQSRSLYRNWAAISKKSTGSSLQSQTNVFAKISTSSIKNDCNFHSKDSSSTLIEERADEIIKHLEQTHSLMDDNPKSKNDRLETLKNMTEYLTLKRSVKRKLSKSIGSTSKTLGFCKRLKYSLSIFFFKIPVTVKHFISSFELWYSSLKVIEGHFGSNVASYFKFLRKLFLLNACIFLLMLFFIMIPQLLFRLFQYVDEKQNFSLTFDQNSLNNETISQLNFFVKEVKVSALVMVKSNPYEENGEFRLGNLFTGEGFLTNTILFYGYYTNTSLKLISGHMYNIPAAYFFTSAVCYTIIFVFLFTSVAMSYRKCYIETSENMRNTFTNKVFCGWDFGIATSQAAELKSKSIYIELKELLDDMSKPTKRKTCLNSFYTTAISFSLNGLLLFLLCLGGMYSWKYLDQQMTKADTATTMMMWLILTLVVAVAPVLFSLMAHLEGFQSPSTALYMTLIRTFTLYAIVVAVVVAYRLNRSSESECWETILGQDMFRLVILDFIFGSIGITLSEFIRYRIFIKMWRGIGCPEFDIARSTMNLIYNQTLFYVGLFFSPVLSLLITIKLFIIFYVKKWGAIYNCKPFVRPWKASQAHTVYLSIAFFAFFCVVIAYGYIITSVKTSNCGPFRGEKFMYERVLEELLANQNSSVLMVFYYITRPGVVGIVLMAMLLGVYYMRAVALARIHVVKHLQYLLRLKAEDRKLLLNEISKYSKNQDPFDDSFLGGVLSYKSVDQNLLDSPKDEMMKKKFFCCNQVKITKCRFSSMNDVHCETENCSMKQANRNSGFSSVQNIYNCNAEENVELNYKFERRGHRQAENFDGKRGLSISENAKSDEDVLPENHPSYSASEEPGNIIYAEVSGEDPFAPSVGLTQPNFNPIFSESVPFNYDYNCDDALSKTSFTERSPNTDEEEKPLADQKKMILNQSNQSSYYRNFTNEERIPSRIAFLPDRKSFKDKKYH